MEYQPKFAELGEQIRQDINPVTAGLQESLASQATAGMQEGVPDWQREEYLSGVRAQLGENAASKIGGDYVSRGMMAQNEQQRRYNQGLGLSLAGRQQLIQPPQIDQAAGGVTAASGMQFTQQGYGSYVPAVTQQNIASSQGQLSAAQSNQQFMSDLIGGGMGLAGGAMSAI